MKIPLINALQARLGGYHLKLKIEYSGPFFKQTLNFKMVALIPFMMLACYTFSDNVLFV